MIEGQVGCTVAALFARDGEARFRALEHETLAALLDPAHGGPATERPAVIATGGGIVLAAANRALLRGAAATVYLHAPAAALVARLRHDTRRPLLQGADLAERLARLQAEREPLYREVATLVVEAHGSTVPRLAERIADALGAAPSPPSSRAPA